MRHALAKILAVFLLFAAAVAEAAPAETGASAGAQIAQRWCVNCHVISSAQTARCHKGYRAFRQSRKAA